jgi:hypothetical protein
MSSTTINKIEAFKAHAFYPLLPMLRAGPSIFQSHRAVRTPIPDLILVMLLCTQPPAPRLEPGRIGHSYRERLNGCSTMRKIPLFVNPRSGSTLGASRERWGSPEWMSKRLQISGCGARRARFAEIAGSGFSESEWNNHLNDPGGP